MRLLYLYISALFIALVFSTQGFAQYQEKDVRFQHLTGQDGLSHQVVWAMMQDQQGFLWFGTEDGLNKYDGYNFEVFRHDRMDKTSIGDNFIYSLGEDHEGNIWVGTNSGGLAIYDRTKSKFYNFKHDPNDPKSIGDNRVYSIHQDMKGNMWIGTLNSGLNKFNFSDSSFIRYSYDASRSNAISSDVVFDIVEDSRGNLYVLTSNSIESFDPEKGAFRRVMMPENIQFGINTDYVHNLSIDAYDNIWIATDHGAIRFSPQTNSFKQFLPSDFFPGTEDRVTNIFTTNNGSIWLATISGLVQLIDQGEGAVLYQSDDTNVNSLAVNELLSLMIDKSGLLWIGTRGGGIDKLNLKRKAFEHYKVNVNSEIGLSSEIVRSICSDDEGNLIIGYQDVGFDIINRETKTKRNIRQNSADASSLSMNNITTIKQFKSGLLWVGTWGGGINIQKSKGAYSFEHLTTATPSSNGVPLMDDRIQMMLEDRFNNVWIGTESGLELYDPARNAHRHFLHDPNNPNTVAAYGVQSNGIVEDAYGNIWVGTWGGLSRLTPEDPGTNTFVSTYHIQRYFFDPEDPLHSISDNRIISLHYDKEKERDVIYAGTYGGGLNKITFSDNDPAKIVVESYTTNDGLPNNVIYTILSDKNGTLWMSTNDGLSNFNPTEKSFKNYDVNDGLQSNQFFWGSSYKSQEGELFFGGINGFNAFFPDEIKDDQYEPPVVLTDFRVFNRSVKPGEAVRKKVVLHEDINETVSLKLTHKENVFSFEFAALHYAFPDDNKYAYMMEGFDEDWIYVDGDQRVASYTNLDADTYTFKVKGANYDGIWNDTPKTIEVVITPPFHKTIWFYAIIVVGITGIIYAFIKWREKQLKEDKDLLQRAIDEKTQELEAQKQEILRRNEAEKVQNWTTAGLAEFSGIINKNKDSLKNLSEALLSRLVKFLNAHQGSITMLNEDDPNDKYLQLITTYAYDQARLSQKKFETDEGLIGACYSEGETNYIKNLPDEYTSVGSGLGESHPRHLLLVPLKLDEIVLGVIEVISFNGFEEHEVNFVEQLAEMVTSTLYTLQVSNRTKELLEQSQSQSEELKAQEEELRQNMEEMEATQEDFTRREQELHEKIETLTNERDQLKAKLSEKVK